MADDDLKKLKEEEGELTTALLCGMPSRGQMQSGYAASKLATWERGAAQFMDRWKFVRERLGLSSKLASIRPE